MKQFQIFLTDYASYNNGTQFKFGHWVDLEQFSDASELMDYIKNHFEECDEKSPLDEYGSKREEIMITDFEGFPKDWYHESMGESDFEKVYAYIEISNDRLPDDDDVDEWISLHNQYCQEKGYGDDEIYENDEDFFQTFFADRIDEAVRATQFGRYHYTDAYVVFNGYGNLDTYDKYNIVDKLIDKDAIVEWLMESVA